MSIEWKVNVVTTVSKTNNLNVQQRIRELMKERNWSDYRLGKEADLSPSTIANMFNRNNSPSLATLESICDAFGISLSQFFSKDNTFSLTEDQKRILASWSKLNNTQKNLLLDFLESLK